jgi:hypothetical protein
VSRILWQPVGCCDAGSLAVDPLRKQEQRKEAHEHTEDAKGLGSASFHDPGFDEEGPGEGDDGAEASDHEA